jgi:hypothetical protein
MTWFRGAFERRRMRQQATEDIQAHLEEKVADLIDAGVPEPEARLQASREFGNILLVTEASRRVWTSIWLERLVQDLRYGARLLARSPGFTAVAVLSLALGIGANTAIFGLLDKIALRMLPVRGPEELRMVEAAGASKRDTPKAQVSYTYTQYALWRDHNRSFTALAATNSGMKWRDQSNASDKVWHEGQFVSGNYFDVLGVPAALGRVLTPEDDSIEGAGGPAGVPTACGSRRRRARRASGESGQSRADRGGWRNQQRTGAFSGLPIPAGRRPELT